MQSTQVRATATELAKTRPLPISQPTQTFRFGAQVVASFYILGAIGLAGAFLGVVGQCVPLAPKSVLLPKPVGLLESCAMTPESAGACRAMSCGSGHKERAGLALARCAH